MTIPLLRGMADIAADYDALILDLWGVVYDGIAPYPGVLDCLAELRRANKNVTILSNAPRLGAVAAEHLRRSGVGAHLYDRIITSGDATRQALERRNEPFYAALGPAYYFLGKEDDAGLLQGLDYRRTEAPDEADFLLVTGPTDESLDLGDSEALLRGAAGLNLAMVCANPDLAVIRGGTREPCAGAFAARYAELGGAVAYQGKPFTGVYTMCFEALAHTDRRRILCVGDGLATDIAGAGAAGLDSLLVTGGLLANAWGVERTLAPDEARLEAACREAEATPTAVIPTFVW